MRIDNIKKVTGPNIFSHDPVLIMTLDLEDLTGKESCDVPGFTERLIALLPGVWTHVCGLGRPGGFVERLRSGTFFGHVVEHVALELSDALKISVNRGKTVSTPEPNRFLVAVTYKSEAGMRFLLHLAVELVEALIRGEDYMLEAALEKGRAIVADASFGVSTQALVDEVQRRNIPWEHLDGSLIRLGYGRYTRFVEATICSRTSAIAVDIAGNKQLTRTLLQQAGLPAPDGRAVTTASEAVAAAGELGGTVVVKPLDGNQGKGVSLNIETPSDVEAAFEVARRYSSEVVVEKSIKGKDYRVLVVNGCMVAASEKSAASVVGDGERTIRDLISIANQDPRRGDNHSNVLSKLVCDEVAEAYLRRTGRDFETIPSAGERVLLRESANLSTGGEARDVTEEVHPSFREICERAARTIGLDICGIDLIAPSINQPWNGEGAILELNAAPGIRMHLHPVSGQPRNVAAPIIDGLFPQGSSGRIPIISITGTNGKTTTTRMVGRVFGEAGEIVGMTTTNGVQIDRREVARGDMTGPWSARVVLHDPSVTVAVLETARGGIVRSGLGYDWSDVGIITNVQPDHLGQDGIETVEDILRIKALVAERVREGGTVVLNADDERLCRLPESPRMQKISRKICPLLSACQQS